MPAVVFAPPVWRWVAPGRALWVALGVALVALGLGLAARAMRDLGPNLSPLPRPRLQPHHHSSRHPIHWQPS